MEYTYLFTVLEDEDMVRGYFADFETLDTFGDTIDEVLSRAKSILALEILEMNNFGEKLPSPSKKDDYKKSLGQNEALYSVTVNLDDYKYLTDEEEDVE